MFLQVVILGALTVLTMKQIINPDTMIGESIVMSRALAPVE
jgi:ABC-type protease/lipase transport system fused ATPase/permease subunit